MTRQQPSSNDAVQHYDAVVIGAGVSGMYALHHLRKIGMSVRLYDGATDVGGTWWYNRYPGARVDGPGSPYYCYTFSKELMDEWDWAETQSTQEDVLAYLDHVASKFDFRKDIQFETWVEHVQYDDSVQRWQVETSQGDHVSATYVICAVGALSTANRPNIPGIKDFAGECYHTGSWPHTPVSFADKRVAVIGTGSSGVQSIPEIAKQAGHLTVLQRTAQFSFPANNRALTAEDLSTPRENWEDMLRLMNENEGGFPIGAFPQRSAMDFSPQDREAHYEALWQKGGFGFFNNLFSDIAVSEEANKTLADFVRNKIREAVNDPETARKLLPDHFVMTKRPILDDGYYETFNRNNVTLVDLRDDLIERFTKNSVITKSGEHPLDMLVLATGYDAISGSMLRLNPIGRDGLTLKDKWQEKFHTYLGMTVNGFPNMFMIHGPGSPGVFYNMPYGAERQMAWIGQCIAHLRDHKLSSVEPTAAGEVAWGEEVKTIADFTLFPRTDSWWTGANVEGKPRSFTAYLGGSMYYQRIADIAANEYEGFEFGPADESTSGA